MTIQTSTLRPGLLVSLKSTVSGNVKYARETIEEEHVIETGAATSEWNTRRTVSDPAEHDAAIKARGKCR